MPHRGCPEGTGGERKRTQCVATQGVWGDRSPMPHRGCPEGTGGERKRTQCVATQGVWGDRSPMPHRGCPEGTGGERKRTQCVATQGVWGDRSPMPHRGCPEGTGGERYRAKLLTALLRRRDRLRRQGLGRCRSGWSVPHQRRRSKVSCFQEDASEETRWRRCWR